MDGEDWVKYVTERFLAFVNTPKEERKQARSSKKSMREDWATRWFGQIALSVRIWANNRKRGGEQAGD